MSANVESLFFVKEPCWHGLGIRVEEALNSKDALIMSGLNWTVDQKKVIVDGISLPNYKANVRSSDGKVLGIVSERYKIVQNVDAFAFTDNIINNGEIEVRYETAGSLANGRRVWMLAQLPKTTILGDDVENYMVFSNSHDGSGAIKVALTNTRVVCQNTLTLALSGAKRSWSVKHMGSMESKLHEAQVSLGFAKDYFGGVEAEAELLQEIKISESNLQEFMNLAFPIEKNITDRKMANAIYMREEYMSMYRNIDNVQKFGESAWKLYNITSDFIGHMVSLRQTKSLQENRFMDLMDGNKTLALAQSFAKSLK